jgi:hypothetical protein
MYHDLECINCDLLLLAARQIPEVIRTKYERGGPLMPPEKAPVK